MSTVLQVLMRHLPITKAQEDYAIAAQDLAWRWTAGIFRSRSSAMSLIDRMLLHYKQRKAV